MFFSRDLSKSFPLKHKIHQNPILVTGSHRSGTAFVGKMLALSPRIGYIDEPFHRVSGIEGINRWFLYIREFLDQKELMHNHLDEILKDCKLENLSIAEDPSVSIIVRHFPIDSLL